jgi:NAD(P) transhydrogenase subunit beta
MSANITALLYLAAGILFILALRGLSSPASSREGNRYGMIGMAVAVATTLFVQAPSLACSSRAPPFMRRRPSG